MSANLAIRNP